MVQVGEFERCVNEGGRGTKSMNGPHPTSEAVDVISDKNIEGVDSEIFSIKALNKDSLLRIVSLKRGKWKNGVLVKDEIWGPIDEEVTKATSEDGSSGEVLAGDDHFEAPRVGDKIWYAKEGEKFGDLHDVETGVNDVAAAP
jgi:hypothetical protein